MAIVLIYLLNLCFLAMSSAEESGIIRYVGMSIKSNQEHYSLGDTPTITCTLNETMISKIKIPDSTNFQLNKKECSIIGGNMCQTFDTVCEIANFLTKPIYSPNKKECSKIIAKEKQFNFTMNPIDKTDFSFRCSIEFELNDKYNIITSPTINIGLTEKQTADNIEIHSNNTFEFTNKTEEKCMMNTFNGTMTTELICKVKGFPRSVVKWTIDGKEITDNTETNCTLSKDENFICESRLKFETFILPSIEPLYECSYSYEYESEKSKLAESRCIGFYNPGFKRIPNKNDITIPFINASISNAMMILGICALVVVGIICCAVFVYFMKRSSKSTTPSDKAIASSEINS